MEQLLAHCGGAFSQHGNMWAVFFLGGLTGSLTHCLVMCGPLVACQSACAGKCGKRMQYAALWPYHAGRLLTYGTFGFVAAYAGKFLSAWSFWPVLSSTMLAAAGTMFIISSFRSTAHRFIPSVAGGTFLRGLLMGFMPCGLLYAAVMMASTLANPWAGMVAMWCFVLGTMPVLLAASLGANVLSGLWNKPMDAAGRLVMALSGISLFTTAFSIMR